MSCNLWTPQAILFETFKRMLAAWVSFQLDPPKVNHLPTKLTFQINVMEMLLMMLVRVTSLSVLLVVTGEVRIENVVEVMEEAVHVEVERFAAERRVTFASIIFGSFVFVCGERRRLANGHNEFPTGWSFGH